MRGSRAANHSTCWSLIRPHGGLPITASKPPVRAASQFRQTPGKATFPVQEPLLRDQRAGPAKDGGEAAGLLGLGAVGGRQHVGLLGS